MKKSLFIAVVLLLMIGQTFCQTVKPKLFIHTTDDIRTVVAEQIKKANSWKLVSSADMSDVILSAQTLKDKSGKLLVIRRQSGDTLYVAHRAKGNSTRKNLFTELVQDVEKNFDKTSIYADNEMPTPLMVRPPEMIERAPDASQLPPSETNDKNMKLMRLKELLDKGQISKEEYEARKKRILEGKDQL